MKSRQILGRVVVLIGVIFVGYASVLFVQNQLVERHARTYSDEVVEQLVSQLEIEQESSSNNDESTSQGVDTLLIDEETYIGIIEIPSLNLILPVQGEWSYEKLKNTPCVYADNPWVIAAHNYDAHFGRLPNLDIGDQAKFTDINGNETYYEVVDMDLIYETDAEAVLVDDYDLTLFTCNYNNNTERVVVRFNEI